MAMHVQHGRHDGTNKYHGHRAAPMKLRARCRKADAYNTGVGRRPSRFSTYMVRQQTPAGRRGCVQVLRLWYPYLSLRDCDLLAEAAPSGHPPQEEAVDTSRTWGEADIALMQREFAALDASGDGTVDHHVRPPARRDHSASKPVQSTLALSLYAVTVEELLGMPVNSALSICRLREFVHTCGRECGCAHLPYIGSVISIQ